LGGTIGLSRLYLVKKSSVDREQKLRETLRGTSENKWKKQQKNPNRGNRGKKVDRNQKPMKEEETNQKGQRRDPVKVKRKTKWAKNGAKEPNEKDIQKKKGNIAEKPTGERTNEGETQKQKAKERLEK